VSQTSLVSCIDDDASVRDALEGFLRASGFAAEAFFSAEEFLQSGRLERTSCLITDVMLPGMSGLQLLDHLTASGHRIPVIVITAFPDEHLRERALSAGAVGFLSKPAANEDLFTCIRSALYHQSSRRQPWR
jgi:FixJ family two-component response regulator